MECEGIFLLLGILALWASLQAVSGRGEEEKPGVCPPDPVRCSEPQQNECNRDYECGAQLKCCHWRCAQRCVKPVQGALQRLPQGPVLLQLLQ
uniref:WAP domain-containing protein n=1 Tax=Crocodylus porosus TaxID=8502 RepID=A0A7M4EMW4_CROPO